MSDPQKNQAEEPPPTKGAKERLEKTTRETSSSTANKNKLDNQRIREILLKDEERLQKHLQPLLYAMLRGAPTAEQQLRQHLDQRQQQQEQQQQKQQEQQQQQQKQKDHDAAATAKQSSTSAAQHSQEKATKPSMTNISPSITPPVPPPSTVPIDDYIPYTHKEIRETPVFRQLYRLIQFQRDQYLVGTEYATWQQNERQRCEQAAALGVAAELIIQTDPSDQLPHDPTAYGHQQLPPLAANFIPSDTVRLATIPLVTPLATDTLYPMLRQACNDIIAGQQENLNAIVKSSLLDFLQNPSNRLAIKKSTHGFIDTKYNENNNSGISRSNGNDEWLFVVLR